LRRFIPTIGTALFAEQAALERERAGGPDEVMEGLDVEEDPVDQDEGEVEDVALGDAEVGES
jgi:hypothetical protein